MIETTLNIHLSSGALNREQMEKDISISLSTHLFCLSRQSLKSFYFHIISEHRNAVDENLPDSIRIVIYSENSLDTELHKMIPNSKIDSRRISVPVQSAKGEDRVFEELSVLFSVEDMREKTQSTLDLLKTYHLDEYIFQTPYMIDSEELKKSGKLCLLTSREEKEALIRKSTFLDKRLISQFSEDQTLDSIIASYFPNNQSHIDHLLSKISLESVKSKFPLLFEMIQSYQTGNMQTFLGEKSSQVEIFKIHRAKNHPAEHKLFNLLLKECQIARSNCTKGEHSIVHFGVVDLFKGFLGIIDQSIRDFDCWSLEHLPLKRPSYDNYFYSGPKTRKNTDKSTDFKKIQEGIVECYVPLKLKLLQFIDELSASDDNLSLKINEWIILLKDIKQYLHINEFFFCSESFLRRKYPKLDFPALSKDINTHEFIYLDEESKDLVSLFKLGYYISSKNPYTTQVLSSFLKKHCAAYEYIQKGKTRSRYEFPIRLPGRKPMDSFDQAYWSAVNPPMKQDPHFDGTNCVLHSFEPLSGEDLSLFQFSSLMPLGHLDGHAAFHDGSWRDNYFFTPHDRFHYVLYVYSKLIFDSSLQSLYMDVTQSMLRRLSSYPPEVQVYMQLYLFLNHEYSQNLLSLNELDSDVLSQFFENFTSELGVYHLIMLQDLFHYLDIGVEFDQNIKLEGKYPLKQMAEKLPKVLEKEVSIGVVEFLTSFLN